jgi:hypothetical protein
MDGLRVDKVLVARVAGSASAEDTPQG